MHIHTRLQILAALGLLSLIPASVAYTVMGSLSEKYEVSEKVDEALDEAEHVHASGRGLVYERDRAQANVAVALETVEEIGFARSKARREMISASRALSALYAEHQFNVLDHAQVLAHIEMQQPEDQELSVIARILRWVRGEGDTMHASAAQEPLLLSVHEEALQLQNDSVESAQQYQQLTEQYQEAWDAYVEARGVLSTAEARIVHVQRVTNEVQAHITALQRELARIDAQLRAKLERALIDKGLMSAQPGERSDGRIRLGKQTFRWPVSGRISAGFYSSSYKAFFGVAHKGIDIVVPQGTAVVASADGVVYLARDGGKYGYSYVLVGHRNGLATLYGHLSSINVSTGQEVAAGSVIGLSGGTPGTYGAGPMTTGAHVHFEVISNGTHINPTTVLP